MKKGDMLIDSSGKKIGYIVSDSIDIMPLSSNVRKEYLMRFAGYINSSDVRPATVVENKLTELILANHCCPVKIRNRI